MLICVPAFSLYLNCILFEKINKLKECIKMKKVIAGMLCISAARMESYIEDILNL